MHQGELSLFSVLVFIPQVSLTLIQVMHDFRNVEYSAKVK